MLRIGLIGASRVGTYAVITPAHAVDGLQVVAVASRDPARAAAYAREHGIERVHSDYAALCSDPDVGVIYIGTPPACHKEQALAAIAAGKAVLVEKPFSLNAAEANAIVKAAQAARVPVFEAMHSLHHALFARVIEVVGSGVLGPLHRMNAEFSVPISRSDGEFRWSAELGGGALMDLGVYPLAWARRLLGDEYKVTHAAVELDGGVDAAFSATLVFPNAVEVHVRSSMVCKQPVARLTIEGARGSLEVTNPLAPQNGHALTLSVAEGVTTEVVPGASTYEAQLLALRNAVLNGIPFPLCPDDPVRSMRCLDAVRSAMKEAAAPKLFGINELDLRS